MKKLSFMLLVVVLTLVACSKDQQTESFRSVTLESQLKDANKNEFYNNITIDGVTKFNDMLWFRDIESILKAEDNLEYF